MNHQLPPVGEDVNLMADPDICLTKIHRQAYGNPVLGFATAIRTGRDWRSIIQASKDPRLQYLSTLDSTRLVMDKFAGLRDRPMTQDPMVICGTNRTRKLYNDCARTGLGPDPVVGDRVICLKNQYLKQVLLANGFRGKIDRLAASSNPEHLRVNISFADEALALRDGVLCKRQFTTAQTIQDLDMIPGAENWRDVGMLFSYGYALTCHRAQGSEAANVIGIVEDFQSTSSDFRRWLYTLASRAKETLTLCF